MATDVMNTNDRRSFLRASLSGLAVLASVPVLASLEGCQQLALPAIARGADGGQDCSAD